MQIEFERDNSHDNHLVSVIETVYDNQVEFSTWAYCHKCEEYFTLEQKSVLFPEDIDEDDVPDDDRDMIEWEENIFPPPSNADDIPF